MKIQAISPIAYSYNKAGKLPSKRNSEVSSPSFKGWNVDGFAIIEMDSYELKQLAEYFHKSSDEILTKISISRNCFGIKNTEESMKAYEKLVRAVNNIKSERLDLMKSTSEDAKERLNELDEKAAFCLQKYYTEPGGFDLDDPVDLANIHWP